MGQEIAGADFVTKDFDTFRLRLQDETQRLEQIFARIQHQNDTRYAGLELEAWLIDPTMRPAPINDAFLKMLQDPMVDAELAKFNIEFNTEPLPLTGNCFSRLHTQLQNAWSNASQQAQKLNSELLMTGILPTLKQDDLNPFNMSDLNRYRALNEQILASRGQPVKLDISGEEHLKLTHHDVMLESAATSLQLHTQIPLNIAHHFYNASIMASAAVVAVSANSPFLFGHSLWQETRIPLFEQAIESGGFDGAAHGPVKRVSFGSDYARHSIFECFEENLAHFPVLLPVDLGPASDNLDYLRLHNGTIWRWNRPIVGFNGGRPHVRIEHRTPAAGPTIKDMLANAVFYFGLSHALCDRLIARGVEVAFSDARDNFYKAARYGLDTNIVDFDGQHQRLQKHILDELLPLAAQGLDKLNILASEKDHYLAIIEKRVEKRQTGSDWQQAYIAKHGKDFQKLTKQYLFHQQQGEVVSEWPI
ncbi:glutamate--cysteine ligase [Methylophaga sp.]|uniref:glutamate--cysteine ligase n=1 Tax=Methylophaga sp. TaxID=2024840 RepID=UPI003F69B2EA